MTIIVRLLDLDGNFRCERTIDVAQLDNSPVIALNGRVYYRVNRFTYRETKLFVIAA